MGAVPRHRYLSLVRLPADERGGCLEPAPDERPADGPDPSSVVVSFTIEDLDAFLAHLASLGLAPLERRQIGPMTFVSLRDPDGRHVCCGTPWPGS
jgi:hypothetical protein